MTACPRCTYYYGPHQCRCSATEPESGPTPHPTAAGALATPPRGSTVAWAALGVACMAWAWGAHDDVIAERLTRLARRCLARVADVPEGVDVIAVIEQLESEER
jgi:hypothetical protein